MLEDNAQKAVAVFGDGIEALLNGYYLQRFGIRTDIFLSQPCNLGGMSNEPLSTWLCLHRDVDSRKKALLGIAELKEIALDLGPQLFASTEGSIVFENRPACTREFERFVHQCKRSGMLVDLVRNPGPISLPVGTLATVRFLQDVSVYPRTLYGLLMEALVRRGATVYNGLGVEQLERVGESKYMSCGGHSRRYDWAVQGWRHSSVGQEESACSSRGAFQPTPPGRYISFERLSNLFYEDSTVDHSEPGQGSLSTLKGAFSGLTNSGDGVLHGESGGGIAKPLTDRKHVYFTPAFDNLAHCAAHAREFAELISNLDFSPVPPISELPPTTVEARMIPWLS